MKNEMKTNFTEEITKDTFSILAKNLKKALGAGWGKELAKRVAEKEKAHRNISATKVYNVINGRIKNPAIIATIVIHASAIIEENNKKITEALNLIENK